MFNRIVKSQGFLYDPLSVCSTIRKNTKNLQHSLAFLVTIAGYSCTPYQNIDDLLTNAEYLTRVTNTDPYDISAAMALAQLINSLVEIKNLNNLEKLFLNALDAGSNIFDEENAKNVKATYLKYCMSEMPIITGKHIEDLQFKCFGVFYWILKETIMYISSPGIKISDHNIKFNDMVKKITYSCDNEYICEILCIVSGVLFGALMGHIPDNMLGLVSNYRAIRAKIVNYLNNNNI